MDLFTYRGRYKDEWIYGTMLSKIGEKYYMPISKDNVFDEVTYPGIYFGFDDVNSRPIFTGDIVRVKDITGNRPGGIGIVKYDEEYAKFYIQGNFYYGEFLKFDLFTYEILGNPIDNQELLGGRV